MGAHARLLHVSSNVSLSLLEEVKEHTALRMFHAWHQVLSLAYFCHGSMCLRTYEKRLTVKVSLD